MKFIKFIFKGKIEKNCKCIVSSLSQNCVKVSICKVLTSKYVCLLELMKATLSKYFKKGQSFDLQIY